METKFKVGDIIIYKDVIIYDNYPYENILFKIHENDILQILFPKVLIGAAENVTLYMGDSSYFEPATKAERVLYG